MCEFMNIKGVFLDLPFQTSHKLAVCTDLVVCSVTSATFTAHSVCSSAAKFFFSLFFSELISTTNSAYLFHIASEYMD